MVAYNRVRVTWGNWSGAPGLSTFYFGSSSIDMTALRTFWDAIKSNIPSGITIQVPNTGDQIQDTTGQISGVWGGGPSQSVVTCTGAGSYAGATGPVVEWLSSAVIAGHRPQGKTYLVPGVGTFDSNGSLGTAVITQIQTAAQALITAYAGEMKVLSRPFVPPTGSTKPPRPGVASTIIAARVPDLAAVLRSRRT